MAREIIILCGMEAKTMSTKIISIINLKGGVAKTTTTVGLAECLSGVHGKKVLVIDLDPQTNCTTMLIGEDKWRELNNNGYTLCTMFRDAVEDTHNFDISAALQKGVSGIRDVKSVDLLPSSLDLIDIQDRIASIPQGKFYANTPTEILKRAIFEIRSNYDYILIDCPPNMGLITLNGLRISTGYIIPTIPDFMSTYGIPQILKRVEQFSRNISEVITCLGIVATKVRQKSKLHAITWDRLRNKNYAYLFETMFYENTQMSQAAEYKSANTLRQKWGYQGQYDTFAAFTNEVIARS